MSRRLIVIVLLICVLAAGCGSSSPPLSEQIRLAVQATMRALPTRTPIPPPTIVPTSTTVPLTGLFCEYQFCIGHPVDMAFHDVSVTQNPLTPSTIDQGILAAYNSTQFIQVMWQEAPTATDPQFMIDLILQSGADTRLGGVVPKVVGTLNVYSVAITPAATAASQLPSGEAAAWLCGGRAFAWKSYTTQQEVANSLLAEALAKFKCAAKP